MDEGNHSHSQRSHSSSSTDHGFFYDRSVRSRYYCSYYEDCSEISSNSYSEDDLISELPDSILIHILSLLPLDNVIATATLSKRWRFLWTMVPNLVFNHPPYSMSRTSPFVSYIDRALLLHECPQIKKFSVDFNYSSEFQSAVDVWLRVATRKNVEELDLDFEQWGRMGTYKLPQHLFTNSSLVKLTLRYCSMKPSGVISWPSLKTLSIGGDAELNDNLIEGILSGSPVLESLELHECSGINRLNITSASLKKLVINGCGGGGDSEERSVLQISAPKVESLSILGLMYRKVCLVTNVPSLLRASLNFMLRMDEEDFRGSYRRYGKLVTNLLQTLNHVEELTIGAWCIQVLTVLEVKKLTSPMSTLKSLILDTMPDKWDHPGIANLLRSSVYLETLVINMSYSDCRETVLELNEGFRQLYNFDEEKYWNSQEGVLVNWMQRLKTVKIVDSCLHGGQIELLLELLRVLLKNARVLQKVVICEEKNADPGSLNSLKVAQRLLSFPRASPKAVILLPKTLY